MSRSKLLVVVVLVVVALSAYFDASVLNTETQQLLRSSVARELSISPDQPLAMYNQSSIEYLHNFLPRVRTMLIVFDGQTFKAFHLGENKNLSFRYVTAIPLMVHALKTTFPDRFKPGSPVFQVLWSIDDVLDTQCVNKGVDCPQTKFFPPLISFSTMHRDESVIPTAKAFPQPHFITCLYNWKIRGINKCQWQEVDKTLKWEDLTPTILWRGSDFGSFAQHYDEFKMVSTHWMRKLYTPEKLATMTKLGAIDDLLSNHWRELTPRWRAAALTLKAKVTNPDKPHYWIDAMFTGKQEEHLHTVFADRGLQVTDPKEMDAMEMSKARYQIDFGGGGGTTWQGTLTKLQMPGVLFHHESPTKDWFYDLMQPWIHYIPVGVGLEDLYGKYQWAEEHQEEAKAISERASAFAEILLSAKNMQQVYDDLFVKYLSKVVHAYDNGSLKSWEECVERYRKLNINVHEIAVCNGEKCHQEWSPGAFFDAY